MFGWAFQSTFPRGERRSLSCIFIHDELFQSTFPRGERLRYGSIDGNSIKFQSTFPRGERQNVCRLFLIFCHFNPRSRVGNDVDINRQIKPNIISIHVPAWGTTVHRRNIMMLILISIHVPAWGTTNWQNNIFYELIYFNPRSRVGNDRL